ncbi:helix-turn-helix domain-containing protein [Bacillus sp. SW14]|uniref:helix-turn-helix domain-containing protein n=1 Tax=Bacillus TaxID=1386 RepID=UPI00374C9E7C
MKTNQVDGALTMDSNVVIRGKTIKVLRTIKNQTLTDMREATGLNISMLSAMENEKRSLSARNQIKLSRYLVRDLGYTADEIIVIQAFINNKEV